MGNFEGNVSGSAVENSMRNQATPTQKKNDFDVKNYLDTKLGKGETERSITIRILPVSNEDGNFRIAVKTHNLKVSTRVAKSGFKSFLCLDDPQIPNYNPDIHCPICEKSRYYLSEARKCYDADNAKSKTLFKKGCSLQAKTTYIVRVIERGKEDEGVKFWRFNENTQGKGIYDALIALYKQRKEDKEEAGIHDYNIFDLDNGRDIVLKLTKTVRADGKEGIAIQVNDKSVDKPLTTDIQLGNKWINDAKKWYNAYTVKPYDYMAIVADDLIPYFDNQQQKMVGKTEEFFLEMEQRRINARKDFLVEEEAASEVLKETRADIAGEMPRMGISRDNGYDLPF